MLWSFYFRFENSINPWSQCLGQERKKYFVSLFIWRQNHSKLFQNRCNPLIWWFITETINSKKIACPGSWYNNVTWWLMETRRWEWYSPPVELKLSSSQKVTVRNECGSHRCSHLSDLGSPDIGRGKRKWSQMIGGGTPNGSGVPFPSTEVNTKKGSFWATLVADGR